MDIDWRREETGAAAQSSPWEQRMHAVDPQFGPRLRELRQQRGWSLRALANHAHVGRSTLSELENGVNRPSVDMARHLDQVLGADGGLAALVAEVRADEDGGERILHALQYPARVDAGAVDALAASLAAQRRLDDAMTAYALLPGVEAQWLTVRQLADDARGPHAGALREVAAEWTQFLGWVLAEVRHDARAVQLLAQAADEADEVDSGPLVAQAANFRGYLARQQGRARAIVRWFMTAAHTPGATRLQRIGDLVQAAHGLALLGDEREARQVLAAASDLTEQVDGEAPPPTAYWLSTEFHRLNIGLAHLGLGDRVQAADHLRAGLASLPPSMAHAEWAAEYREALADAVR